jgi:choline dehydrogenase-like flavoprotein
MHIDARNLPDHSLIEGDLCIVGTGPAGMSMAMDWDNTPYNVILLEGGGFEFDAKIQECYKGRNTGQPYFPLSSAALHYFGGSSNHWGGFCSPFDELDFLPRPWVPLSGWPFRKAELDPFYTKAMVNVDLPPSQWDLAWWQQKDPQLVSLLPDNPVVCDKVWQFSPPTLFGPKYGPAIKASENIHLYTYANVVDITANANVSNIESMTVKNFAGKTHTVKAKRFVLACGGIQNPRILLSCNPQAPKGLGNDRDVVGRYFMEHLEIQSAWLHLPNPDPLKLYMKKWAVTKMRCELAITHAAQEKHGILHGTSCLIPYREAKDQPAMAKVWNDPDPRKSVYNANHSHPFMWPHRGFDSRFQMFTRIEQAPNANSRVTLDKETDAFGMPLPILHWDLTSMERRSLRTMHELIGRQLGAAGVGRVELMEYLQDPDDASWPDFTSGGWHHMGTTRMCDDPNFGVVDSNSKVHGIANLYITGSSIYSTAGAPNPTLTVVAVSLRLSDHLKKMASS